MRVLLVLLIAAAGFAPGAADVAAQTATPAASEIARTNLRYFLPFSEDGLASSLTVTKNVKAECLLPSLADVGRPDAWMCSDPATDEIFDPCFENPFTPIDEPGELACVGSPFANDVVRLTLTAPLQRFKDQEPTADDRAEPDQPNRHGDASEATAEPAGAENDADTIVAPLDIPWALELANGKRCALITGATVVLAGQRLNYACDGGHVLGEVDRGSSIWTVSYLPAGAVASELVAVTVAWT